jgi:hypothetical protein
VRCCERPCLVEDGFPPSGPQEDLTDLTCLTSLFCVHAEHTKVALAALAANATLTRFPRAPRGHWSERAGRTIAHNEERPSDSLQPRSAGLTALTASRSSPVLGSSVMVGQS